MNAAGVSMTKTLSRLRAASLAAPLALLSILAAQPAHADQCEDLAKQLATQIDGLKVNFRAVNTIYLSHAAAKEMSIGCRGREFSTELYAKGDRKPKPPFYDLIGSAAAIIFTVPKDDTTKGATRCLTRMGLLRGDKVAMRFRRLNMECTRTKADASIVIRRGKDE